MCNKVSVSGWDGFIFVERDFPTSEKKLFKSSHCFWHSESSESLFFLLGFVFYYYYFIDKLPCFFYIVMALLESLFIIILLGDFF